MWRRLRQFFCGHKRLSIKQEVHGSITSEYIFQKCLDCEYYLVKRVPSKREVAEVESLIATIHKTTKFVEGFNKPSENGGCDDNKR